MRAPWVGALLFVLVLSGCTSADDEPPATPPAPPVEYSAAKPTMSKLDVEANPTTSQTSATDALLGMPPMIRRDVAVPAATERLQVAIDVRPDPASAAARDIAIRWLRPDGSTLYEMPRRTDEGKTIQWLDAPGAGTHAVVLTYRGSWQVGLVLVFEPVGFTPGSVQSVATPTETQINHSFRFPELNATSGQPSRITLYDYDPHPGIKNLQHNLVIPAAQAKTEGRTTWGEVRVLDFVAPATPGAYEFLCEYHVDVLRGTLRVDPA